MMRKELRRVMAKLRVGTAELRFESGRCYGLKRKDRICGQCSLRKVENVEHFVLWCGGLVREREALMKRMAEVTAGFLERGDGEKVVLVLDAGCRDFTAGKAIECIWKKRFCAPEWPQTAILDPYSGICYSIVCNDYLNYCFCSFLSVCFSVC